MAVEETDLGFKVPDGNELVRGGDNVIAHNAVKAQDLIAAAKAAAVALAGRVGVAEARISAGLGGGPGVVPDPDYPGLYFMATEANPFTEDPDNPGLYTF